jgi:thioredoxin 1
MQKGWKIAVVVLLIAAVAVTFAMKNRNDSGDTSGIEQAAAPVQSIPEPPAAEAPSEQERAVEEVSVRAEEPTEGETQKPAPKPTEPANVRKVQEAPQTPVHMAKTEPEPKPVKLPKLLDLGADKCIPCKQMEPILEELKKEYAGRLEVVFIDVWKDGKAAQTYGIRSIPTQIFYDAEGNELSRHVGFFSKGDILGRFKEHGIEFGE